MKFGLEVQVIENIISVLEQHPKVDKAFVFGSRAKGNYRLDSDIDIAIKGNEITTDDIIAISVAIETKGITHKFDLIDYNTIKEPALKEHINRVGIEFYSRWKEYKISELGKVVTGNTPSSKFPEEFGTEMPFVTPTDYKNYNKSIYSADRYLSDKGISKLKSRILPVNSILVTCIGSDMGKVALNKILVVTNQQINSIIINEKVISDFLYYKLVSSYDVLRTYGEAGTAVPIVNKSDFENIEITIPTDLKEQTAIASILSSLDDKIDLLHRQNKSLEQLAETLFRQWFVEEADESWEVSTLGKIGKVITGKTPSTKQPEYWGNDIPFITPSDFSEYFKYTNSSSRFISEKGLNSMKNSIIPENSLIVTCIGSDMGKIAISTDVCVTNQQINSLILNADFPFLEYIYNYLKSIYNHLRNIAMGGTTMPIINKSDFENIEIIIPSRKILFEFESITETYSRKIKLNQTQIRTLTQTRDTLLPKLMSGEVRVEM